VPVAVTGPAAQQDDARAVPAIGLHTAHSRCERSKLVRPCTPPGGSRWRMTNNPGMAPKFQPVQHFAPPRRVRLNPHVAN
jgi:hypothetical protein